jgi:hypothetical protein
MIGQHDIDDSYKKTMSMGERDKLISDIATKAADEYYRKNENATDLQIKSFPETYLQHTIPYLTVRTLRRLEETLKRHETALKSLKADSRWIRVFAIITGILTVVLVFLTIVLARYPLEDIIRSLSK